MIGRSAGEGGWVVGGRRGYVPVGRRDGGKQSVLMAKATNGQGESREVGSEMSEGEAVRGGPQGQDLKCRRRITGPDMFCDADTQAGIV